MMEMTSSDARTERRSSSGHTLACLEGRSLAARFSAWRGASGRRYVCTVYPFDRVQPACGLPPYEGMIAIAVRRSEDGTRDVLAVAEISANAAPSAFLTLAVDEWHVHLMAEHPRQRAAALRDLLAR